MDWADARRWSWGSAAGPKENEAHWADARREQDGPRGRAVEAEGGKNEKQRGKAMGRLEKNWAAAKTEEGEGKYRIFLFSFHISKPN